ncbi:DsbC family protein [Xanthomonas citri]|uniref:Thiol:disulfide interchange protein n=3 Tax=Xanthomonas citri TaxID=346 RepID=A0A0U5BXG3_XANCI|nr:DsbC family protein [Xanthomonas citri]CEG18305.1 Disulfide isomerase [Xanthomonas citri pv. citri]CEH76872.1 Disulfide isomerase [Xanthomonas citri pv. citri]CEH76903.1 Disulfide isomerase [Xanthomonas citri pv. citri]
MYRLAIAALLGAISLTACAQSSQPAASTAGAKPAAAPAATGTGTVDQRVSTALKALDPDFKPDYIGVAPFPGFREVVVGGQVLYVSDDGRYLIQAQPFDIQNKQFAASPGLLAYRRKQLDTVPKADRIVFAPANPKYTVTVFTDVECGYCRKLHSEIGELNKQGIAVEYLAFPRMGLGSQDHKEMIAVWCAADRKQALTAAKSGQPVASKDCKNPVSMEYNLGQRLGVNGTPAIFAPDGTQLGGYLPPAQLREALEKRAVSTAGGSR